MKRCVNARCDGRLLYGDERLACPLCGQRLVRVEALGSGDRPGRESETADPPPRRPAPPPRDDVYDVPPMAFVTPCRGGVICRGRVAAIERQALFNSRRHRLANTLLRGEPYQFDFQTLEYALRVESLPGMPMAAMDFSLYGNYLGRMQPGDEVVVRAWQRADRAVVRDIENITTGARVRPGLQLPAWALWLLLGLLAAAVVALSLWLTGLFRGRLDAGMQAAPFVALPALIVLLLVVAALRLLFPRRWWWW